MPRDCQQFVIVVYLDHTHFFYKRLLDFFKRNLSEKNQNTAFQTAFLNILILISRDCFKLANNVKNYILDDISWNRLTYAN